MKTDKISETLEIVTIEDSTIEVFVTNVNTESEAEVILSKLRKKFSELHFSLDHEDCDKVLRVEGFHLNVEEIQTLLKINGFTSDVMNE
ncbi:MAG TPA: hypothetical protein VKG26_10805 [Bacteroidia bacterium]|nr:hypothetical protein [Bacteroidia bacterium]